MNNIKYYSQIFQIPRLCNNAAILYLEVDARKAAEDLQEGQHVGLAREELEISLLEDVAIARAPTWFIEHAISSF